MASLLMLAILGCGQDRYLCGPGTHVEGDWCVRNEDTAGYLPRDSGSVDDSGDTGGGAHTGETGDTADSGETGETGEPVPARLVINEFMASNDTKASDEHGGFDDWIEIFNAGGETATLGDCALTDDSEELALYTFPPAAELAPGGWAVVWADGVPAEGPWHASFTLSSTEDRVFLVRDPLGSAEVLDAVEFAGMATDVAAARVPDGADTWVNTENVTPGSANLP